MGVFKSGMKVKSLHWPGPGEPRVEAGKYECVSLTITEENGQGAPVAWCRQVSSNGSIVMHNLAMAETVVLVVPATGDHETEE